MTVCTAQPNTLLQTTRENVVFFVRGARFCRVASSSWPRGAPVNSAVGWTQ